jgi:RNA polymerase sigma-70 factor (ECF subfamily)
LPLEPEELAAQAQQGNEQAFASLVSLYEQAARRVAWQVLGNMADADDALQEAWMIVWRQLGSLRDTDCFGPWLYRIVANVSLRKRQQRAASTAKIEVLRHLATDCAADTAEDSGQDESAAEMLEGLTTSLQALSAKDRLVTTLHYFSGVPIDAIADLLDLPAGTVKSRLFHARQTIRKEIERWQAK